MANLHRGKLATNPKILTVRPLTRDDLACLSDKRPTQGVAKAFRHHHHRIARMAAMGLRPHEIQAQAGISSTRWVQLQGDPAFQELVAQNRAKVDIGFVDAATELYTAVAANTINAELLVAERLELALEGEADIPLKILLAISRDGADRVGLPKMKIAQNTNVNLDFAAMLEAAAKRSGRSNVIDAVPMSRATSLPKGTMPPSLPSAQPIALCRDGGATPPALQEVVPRSSKLERSAIPVPASATVAGPIRRRA